MSKRARQSRNSGNRHTVAEILTFIDALTPVEKSQLLAALNVRSGPQTKHERKERRLELIREFLLAGITDPERIFGLLSRDSELTDFKKPSSSKPVFSYILFRKKRKIQCNNEITLKTIVNNVSTVKRRLREEQRHTSLRLPRTS
jgi:hypothetical protein